MRFGAIANSARGGPQRPPPMGDRVKHGHVVQSPYCCWPVFGYGYGHPSIQTLVAWSLDNELPNCQSHLLSLSLAYYALWPFVCLHFSFKSMSSDLNCFLL